MAQEIADSTLLDTWGSGGNIVEPDISKIIEGWQLGEQPPHEYMNWLQNTFGSKLNHILKNGVAGWNNETEYLAGSSVQHNGNVWLCKTTNTNSEPTDVNANWKRIITVEALTTVLNGYVKNTGDETIAGVKTFSSSPIVPTPSDTDNSTKVSTTAWSKLGFAISLTESGYIKFPNWLGGLTIQWGEVGNNNSLGSGFNTLVFPISFPNECFSIAKMNIAASGGGYNTSDASFESGGLTASGASWIAYGSNNNIVTTPGTVAIKYIAIGH